MSGTRVDKVLTYFDKIYAICISEQETKHFEFSSHPKIKVEAILQQRKSEPASFVAISWELANKQIIKELRPGYSPETEFLKPNSIQLALIAGFDEIYTALCSESKTHSSKVRFHSHPIIKIQQILKIRMKSSTDTVSVAWNQAMLKTNPLHLPETQSSKPKSKSSILDAFDKIHEALYLGESGPKRKIKLPPDNISKVQEIKKIAQKDPSGRVSVAWTLAQAHAFNCHAGNIDLFHQVYKYSFTHSFFGVSKLTGKTVLTKENLEEQKSAITLEKINTADATSRTGKIRIALNKT